jgi:hypothetical protein
MRVTFGCNALIGTNKVGELHPDKDGYREVILGSFDAFSQNGGYYPWEAAKAAFEQSSAMMQRVRGGNQRGEVGHPHYQPGMTKMQYINRILTIAEPNICVQIAEFRIDDTLFRNKNGEKMVTVLGKVIPSGVHHEYLERQFANPKENVCFSLRALTKDVNENGQLVRHLGELVTYDQVNEGGMAEASKYNSPALESKVFTFDIDPTEINTMDTHGVATESVDALNRIMQVSVQLEPRSKTFLVGGGTKPVFMRF